MCCVVHAAFHVVREPLQRLLYSGFLTHARAVAPDGASYTFAEFTNHYGVAVAAGMW